MFGTCHIYFLLEDTMSSPEEVYYFAYGSNMNDQQMAHRCPGAKKVGHGVINNYKLVERLYADIEKCEGSKVDGLVWLLNEDHKKSLDKYEGYPVRYDRHDVEVVLSDKKVTAIVYEMTDKCRAEREGKPYPEEYRIRCRTGAESNGIPSAF